MGDQQDRLAAPVEAGEQPQHLSGALAVEASGGFVGEQQTGGVDQGAGEGDALLFAAGQLARCAVLLAGQTQLVEQLGPVGAGLPGERPASSAGSSTLSATVRLETRLKNWKTMPMWLRRSTAQRASL